MDPPLFLSLMALFNMYIYVVSFLYAPCTGMTVMSYDIPEAEKERREIMSAFYETELEEGKDEETNG